MITIEDIDFKLQKQYEFGHEMPEFAFVHRDVINKVFYEGISAGHIPNSHYGFSGFALWVSVGRLELVPCNFLSCDEVVFSHSRNMILNILYKLGLEYGKNSIYR